MKKSKWDIIGKDIDKDNHEEYDYYFSYWYDGEDYFDYYYEEDYEYLEPVYQYYIFRRGKIHVSIGRSIIGSYINMMSIYGTQLLRQKKIDYLLGIDKWGILTKPTIGDLMKNKKRNES
jgi:hypothetical protein